VGVDAMNLLNSTLILLTALIAIYLECTFDGVRRFLGAQIDLLPPLIVYAALRSNPVTMAILAVGGGLCFDSLSANPLGVTIMPLFVVGFAVYIRRELILQDEFYAQFVIGATASAVVPALTVVMLLSGRQSPVLGWGSLWQWVVMITAGGLATPILFWVFDRLNRALTYLPATQTSFRQDREIARGRK
jgi:rod shape-determining protein MreD